MLHRVLRQWSQGLGLWLLRKKKQRLTRDYCNMTFCQCRVTDVDKYWHMTGFDYQFYVVLRVKSLRTINQTSFRT